MSLVEMARILVTGTSGLVGSHLCQRLKNNNYEVIPIRRDCKETAFRNGDILIHLAGANISKGRWTRKRKKEILTSRIETADKLFSATVQAGIMPEAFITASATGYYGALTSEHVFSETDPPASDFLGETCSLWEAAADRFGKAGIRTVKVRTAIVLAQKGSALSRLTAPASLGIIVRLGPGSQYFPWIHIEDLCSVYLKAVEDTSMTGPYNASAPDHITHDTLMREVAKHKRLPVFLPHIPRWILNLALGEMSDILTTGSRTSCDKLIAAGFRFRYPDIGSALMSCINA